MPEPNNPDALAELPAQIAELIPKDAACTAALSLARRSVPAPIFNHSLRVFLLSLWLAERDTSEWPRWWAENRASATRLLFIASLCHDLGASDAFNGPQRFEVEGADAAKAHCLAHGIGTDDAHAVWTAIAIHTSAGIAERIDPLSRLIRLGVRCDFSTPEARDALAPGASSYAQQIEAHLPRLEVERELADAVVKQGLPCASSVEVDSNTWPSSEKHPKASWPGILMRAHLENPAHNGWEGGRNPAF